MAHILVVTQCCKAKIEKELFHDVNRSVVDYLDDDYRKLLVEGRRGVSGKDLWIRRSVGFVHA